MALVVSDLFYLEVDCKMKLNQVFNWEYESFSVNKGLP